MDLLAVSSRGAFAVACVVVIAGSLAVFITKLYRARMFIRQLRAKGMPMPAHSFAFGHMLVLQSIFKHLPSDLHKMLYFGEIMQRDFSKGGIYYIDLWPFSEPIIMIVDPDLATQATQTNSKISMQRPPSLQRWFAPFVGGPNLFDLPEKEWKPWRQLFNQGFSAGQNLSLVPLIVEESLTYCETLRKLARQGDIIKFDAITLRYIMDVMGRTMMHASLNAQHGYNPLVDSMQNQIAWHMVNQELDPLQYLNFVRPIKQWWNGRVMDQYCGAQLDRRYTELKRDVQNTRSKSVIDLILKSYIDNLPGKTPPAQLDPEFRTFAIRQIRLFAFAGQGSTSASISYAIHLLSTHPKTLAQLREEHYRVFGHDLSTVATQLSEQPRLLNQLPYTKAVIKEATRLFPAASGVRWGAPGADLVAANGTRYPTKDCMVFILHPAVGRSPTYWPQPDAFLPERWLVAPGHELYPPKGAWRPFEVGPRNCIGQDLVIVEMEVALVMVARQFDFAPAYDEWDAAHPRKGPRSYRGDRAYQVEAGAAHPSEKYPCRVALAAR